MNLRMKEAILTSWLNMIVSIDSQRISDLPFNEALVCNCLNQSKTPLTASDLCRMTKTHKSLMNRTLNALEEKGVIYRQTCANDKRKQLIYLDNKHSLYAKSHKEVLKYVDRIVSQLKPELQEELTTVFDAIASAGDKARD